MPSRSRTVGCAFSVATLLFVSGARAQDSATAGALFEKGVADMEGGHFDTACPAIEESQRIDPRPGTLFTVAECQARWGKVASAAARYQEYVDLVSRLPPDQQQRHKARADIARTQLQKLKPTVPTLTLSLPPDAPQGTYVTRNGELLKGAALGLALPVDPGAYVIVTHVPGAPDRESRLSVQLGEAKRVQLDTTVGVATPVAAAPPARVAEVPSAPPSEPARGSGRRSAAYVAGGIGAAGIVVGSVTGILVLTKKGTVKDNCTSGACNDAGLAAANSGKTLATVSDLAFGAGLAGLAVASILLLTGGSEAGTAEHEGGAHWRPILLGENGTFEAGLSKRW